MMEGVNIHPHVPLSHQAAVVMESSFLYSDFTPTQSAWVYDSVLLLHELLSSLADVLYHVSYVTTTFF